MSFRAWAALRFARKVIFALATVLSIAWTIILTILLLREWTVYSVGQRRLCIGPNVMDLDLEPGVIVIMSLAINAVSAIFSYLMIVVMFQLRQDAVRVAFFLMLQLVLSYGFYLVVMSYIPPPPPNPEAALLDTKQAYFLGPPVYSKPSNRSSIEKRHSVGSGYSYGSFIQPPPPSPSIYRSPLNTSVGSMSHGKGAYSRPSSAASMSSALDLTSTVRGPQNSLIPYLSQTSAQGMNTSESLPNPFADPVSRFSSPSSVVVSEMHLPLQLPPALYFPYEDNEGQGRPLPPAYVRSRHLNALTVPPNATENPLSPSPWANIGTPTSLRPSLQPPPPPRKYAASPGIESIHSMVASLHSVRSGGPEKGSQMASPTLSTRFLGLPTTPRLTVRQLPLEIQHGSESTTIAQQRGS
ncbi:hypothetical protein C0995_002741 [Termitomyces sp. Mi166|nr:hypothetical protein C0995_002741 [Termitomyces sp. Mi166\